MVTGRQSQPGGLAYVRAVSVDQAGGAWATGGIACLGQRTSHGLPARHPTGLTSPSSCRLRSGHWDEAEDWVATLGPGAQLTTSQVRLDGGPAWASLDRSEHPPYPMTGVLQVYVRDVPELPFPHGTDLFQLLWCPNNHDEPWYGPGPSRRGVTRPASPSRSPTPRRQHSIPLLTQPPTSRHHACFCPSG